MLLRRAGLPLPSQGSETMAPVVLGVTLGICSLALIVVMIRLYSRAFLTRFLGADDYWMIAAMVFAIGDEVLKIMWCSNGLGMHINDVPEHNMIEALKITYAIVVTYPFTLGLVKISILTFYLRIFPSRNFRKVCLASIGINVGLIISVSLAQAFACQPIRIGWSDSPDGHCVHRSTLQYAASILNLVTDLAILVLPMKYLWALSLEPKKRYQTVGIFSMGLLTCVASAVRLSSINAFYNGTDPTYDAWPIAIWSGIELNLAIITASLPSLKPLVHKYVRPLMKCCSTRRTEVSKQRKGSNWTGSSTMESTITRTETNS